jgi:hypothetical protein
MNIIICVLLSYVPYELSHLWRDKMKLYHKPLQGFRKYCFPIKSIVNKSLFFLCNF